MSASGMFLEVKRFSVHDGPGVRTTLFLKGCVLRCRWCHNPESIASKPQLAYYEHKCVHCGECVEACPAGSHGVENERHYYDREKCAGCGACEEVCLGGALQLYGKRITVDKAFGLVTVDRDYYGDGGGVTLSGGEPLVQVDFCYELLRRLKENGIHTAVDTCGGVNWGVFDKVLPVTDMFLYDFKHADSERHKELTGQGNKQIIANLKLLSQRGTRVEVRMPLIPGCNDDEENVRATGELLGGLRIERVKVLGYHAMAGSKYAAIDMADLMPRTEMPSDGALREAVELLRSYGVNAVSGRE